MEADSTSWEKDEPFFENERGTFVIQMWWLYMQGTMIDNFLIYLLIYW